MKNITSPQQQLSTVNRLVQQKNIEQALPLVKDINQNHPDFSPAWLTSAFLYFQTNQLEKASDALVKARKLEPENINYAFQEMMMMDNMNSPEHALKIAKYLVDKTLYNDEMYIQLANILNKNEDFLNSLTVYEYLSQRNPRQVGWLLKQAMVLLNLGQINKAKTKTQEALTIQANNPDVLFFRSHLEKQTTNNNHITELSNFANNTSPNQTDQSKVQFSLAKELEDCHQYAKSMEVRLSAASIFRKSFDYDLQSDISFMQQIRQEYSQDFVNRKIPGCHTKEPFFIVGLPRSGTTLLDRIISSHSDVHAAGELKQFNHCMLHNLKKLNLSPQLSRSDMVTASVNMNFAQLGTDYLRTSRTRTGGSAHFTDKFPQNSHYVGMILKALPEAKVIIMQRHPVAVCYAVFKQMFNHDSYPYSYDLEEMATYFIEHQKLLNHWQNIGGSNVKTIFYEDLVTDLEQQARDTYDFLGLDWQPDCLDFHKNSQPTATASASQVRQKLYTGSLDLWKNYEQQLEPLITILDQAGCLSNPNCS